MKNNENTINSTINIQINNGVLSGRIPGYPKDESTYHQGLSLSDFRYTAKKEGISIITDERCIIDPHNRANNKFTSSIKKDNLENLENIFPSYAKLFLITKYQSFFYTKFYKINTEFAYDKNGNIRHVEVSVEYAILWPWDTNEPSKFVKYEILEQYNGKEYIPEHVRDKDIINYQCSFLDNLIKKIVTPGSDGSRYTVDYDKLQDLFAKSITVDKDGMPRFNEVQEVENDESQQEISHNNNNNNNNNNVVTSVIDPSIYESTLAGDIENLAIAACTIS